MPIPKPSKGEKEKDFISRCISTLTKGKEFDSQDQRIAVCYTQWGDKMKENIITIKEDVTVGDIILEAGDKIKVLEAVDTEKLAKQVKEILWKANVSFDRIAYDPKGEVMIMLGWDYPDAQFDDVWNALGKAGYSYNEYDNIIGVMADASGGDIRTV